MRYFPHRIADRRFDRAKQLGATLDLGALRTLFARCKDTPVLVGRTHGDLHAANVRVRATDAVVIDFYAHRDNQPLIFDAATLEASFGRRLWQPRRLDARSKRRTIKLGLNPFVRCTRASCLLLTSVPRAVPRARHSGFIAAWPEDLGVKAANGRSQASNTPQPWPWRFSSRPGRTPTFRNRKLREGLRHICSLSVSWSPPSAVAPGQVVACDATSRENPIAGSSHLENGGLTAFGSPRRRSSR